MSDKPRIYKLINPSDSYLSDATIERSTHSGLDFFSVYDNQQSFHFISHSLRGAKSMVTKNFGKGLPLKWEILLER